jgi:Arc/MetJ-type ribon-helix-helix transcriptional regulator
LPPIGHGILGGLMASYVPDAGNFDAWVKDPRGGGQLDLGSLDLIQKRNHILKAALGALSVEGRRVVSILALLSEAVDGATLSELNPEFSPAKLAVVVNDLKARGLLQYEAHTRRYDLHPVVRSVAAGQLRTEEKAAWGRRAVDHFSARPHRPYDEAEIVDDVRDGLHVVRTLLKMGRYQQASDAYRSGLADALAFNLEANAETLSLLRPLFPHGWAALPASVDEGDAADLANAAAIALGAVGDPAGSLAAYGAALASDLRTSNWWAVATHAGNIGAELADQNRLAHEGRLLKYGLRVASLTGNQPQNFWVRVALFRNLATIGQSAEATAAWHQIEAMGRNWPRASYRPGNAEFRYAQFRFWQGDLEEKNLARPESLAQAAKNREVIRWVYGLRGAWLIERGEWAKACESLREAVSMARAVGQIDARAETQMALAQFHLGQLDEPRHTAEQLANAANVSHRALADLWLAIGDHDQTKKHGLAAYNWAWADGEPYVRRYELNKARAILETVGAEIPNLPPYDPAKADKFPCEDELAAAIERLEAEKKAREAGAP